MKLLMIFQCQYALRQLQESFFKEPTKHKEITDFELKQKHTGKQIFISNSEQGNKQYVHSKEQQKEPTYPRESNATMNTNLE